MSWRELIKWPETKKNMETNIDIIQKDIVVSEEGVEPNDKVTEEESGIKRWIEDDGIAIALMVMLILFTVILVIIVFIIVNDIKWRNVSLLIIENYYTLYNVNGI